MRKKPKIDDGYIPNAYQGGVVKYMTEYTGGSIRHQAIRMIDVQRAMHDMERDVRRFAADLEAYYKETRPADAWRPISEAEKDKDYEGAAGWHSSPVQLAVIGRCLGEGFWHHSWNYWCYNGSDDSEIYDPQPTHWQPLPQPPKEA